MRPHGEWLRARIREQKAKIQRGILSGATSQRDADALDALQRRIGSRSQARMTTEPGARRPPREKERNPRD